MSKNKPSRRQERKEHNLKHEKTIKRGEHMNSSNYHDLKQQIDLCKTSLDFSLNATKARARSNYSAFLL